MTHTHGSFTCSLVGRRISFIAALSCVLVVLTVSVEAGQQRAKLSKDLSDRLAAGVEAPTDVIVAGSDEQIEALATRYGARIKKRLRNAAVLEVSGGQLRDLSEDAEVANLSGDVPVRPMATRNGRDDWRRSGVGRASGDCKGSPAAASAWR